MRRSDARPARVAGGRVDGRPGSGGADAEEIRFLHDDGKPRVERTPSEWRTNTDIFARARCGRTDRRRSSVDADDSGTEIADAP
jgi:hypothetical protein